MDLKNYIEEAISSRGNTTARLKSAVKQLMKSEYAQEFAKELSDVTGFEVRKTYTYVRDRIYRHGEILLDQSGTFSEWVLIQTPVHLYCILFEVAKTGIQKIIRYNTVEVSVDNEYCKTSGEPDKLDIETGIAEMLKDATK